MKFKFGITKKVVLGLTGVSIVTYGTSAIFLLFLRRYFAGYVPEGLFVLSTLALGVFWTALLGVVAARLLIGPLRRLTESANEVAAGRLDVAVAPTRSDDELRALGLSFEAMIRRLRVIVEGIHDNHRLTDRHAEELRTAIESATRHIRNIASRVEQIASGAALQSKSAESMLESVARGFRTTRTIHETANAARRAASEMDRTIRESESVMLAMADGMRALAELNLQSLDAVKRLDEHANRIGEISNVVGGIADQTHLLALNAAIEAAKAGEEGRGFAVVAEAVKKLAGQSADSVEHIRELIDRIQSEIKQVLTRIAEQAQAAAAESAQSERTVESLREIAGEAGHVVGMVGRIADMVTEQNEQMGHLLNEAQSVVGIAAGIRADASDATASTNMQQALMEELAASSVQLKAHSDRLKANIAFFKA